MLEILSEFVNVHKYWMIFSMYLLSGSDTFRTQYDISVTDAENRWAQLPVFTTHAQTPVPQQIRTHTLPRDE